MKDIRLAVQIVRERGARDLGQGAIVACEELLEVEDAAGTDAMLRRTAASRQGEEQCGVLVKLPKPGQERRVDLPTIGIKTLENAAVAGLVGIAYEANGALFVDFVKTVARANELGLFILGLPEGTGEGTNV